MTIPNVCSAEFSSFIRYPFEPKRDVFPNDAAYQAGMTTYNEQSVEYKKACKVIFSCVESNAKCGFSEGRWDNIFTLITNLTYLLEKAKKSDALAKAKLTPDELDKVYTAIKDIYWLAISKCMYDVAICVINAGRALFDSKSSSSATGIKELSSALNDYKTMPDGWKKDEIVELLNSLSGISPEQNAMIVLLKMLDIDNSDIQKLSGIKLPD